VPVKLIVTKATKPGGQRSSRHPRVSLRPGRTGGPDDASVSLHHNMQNFGGLVAGIDGVVTDLVRGFTDLFVGARLPYNRRAHVRRVRALNARWSRLALEGRPFLVMLPPSARRRVRYDVDATLDQGGTDLYLRTEAECRRLLRRRRHALVWRRSPRNESWRKVRALCVGDVFKRRYIEERSFDWGAA